MAEIKDNIPFYSTGNKGFIIRKLNADKSGYAGDAVHISGLISITGSLERTITNINADKIPDYATLVSPFSSSGAISLVGVPAKDLDKFLDVSRTEGGSVLVGEGAPSGLPTFVSISWEEDNSDGSSNRMVLFNVLIKNLPIGTTTNGDELKSFAFDYDANFVVYLDSVTSKQIKATYMLINEVDNKEEWELYKDTIVFPSDLSFLVEEQKIKLNQIEVEKTRDEIERLKRAKESAIKQAEQSKELDRLNAEKVKIQSNNINQLQGDKL